MQADHTSPDTIVLVHGLLCRCPKRSDLIASSRASRAGRSCDIERRR
jgi:hypothetical protein